MYNSSVLFTGVSSVIQELYSCLNVNFVIRLLFFLKNFLCLFYKNIS